ncbi:MAG: UPF0182 family protein [Clostridia bacterium]|nr:UPF0182 family protein [Clostridia bacterium]
MKNIKKHLIKLIIAIPLLLFILITPGVNIITDYLWFDSIDLSSVFMVRILTKLFIFIPLWIFFGGFLLLYLRHLNKSYTHLFNFNYKKLITPISIALGALIAFTVSGGIWLDYLKLVNLESFDQVDPIFGMDISFYFFVLPFVKEIIQILITFLGFVLIGTTFIELIFSDQIKIADESLRETPSEFVSRNLNKTFFIRLLSKTKYLVMLLFLLIGAHFFLKTYDLLYSDRGITFGAGYTDINVTLWAYRTYTLVAVLAAIATFFASKKKKFLYFASGPIAIIALTIIFSLTASFVQKLVVEPDEISKEREYLVNNIEFTQKAYNLNKVDLVEYPYEETLNYDKIQRNTETISNIRINDERPLNQTFNQIQSIRLYYDFYDIDIDRYYIDGEYTQVFISARELDQYKLDNKAMTWINQFLKYTHGYGIVMSPVNRVTNEGQPELLFKNIPPITTTDLVLNRPEIYFGEQTEKYIIVNTDEKEFDYPSGSDNVETMYSGDAGIRLGTMNKLLFSIKERSMKLLVSNNINSESKIIINRKILNRVNEIAPFLEYDTNPYIVLSGKDGKLYWIIDAYTTSKAYPYSQTFKFNGKALSYIRNSVKVVIDAYDGTTKFYIYDEDDPLIATYSNIYKDLFEPRSEFPDELVPHTRYPQDYFDLQSRVFMKYHVNNPVVFYNGEDVWDIATEKYMGDVQTIQSNYVMFKIEEKAEFALILPYTPKGKPNMTSLLVARNDEPNYGKVFLYRFPKDKTIQGPIMIESRIDQDSVISPQFTLWGQQGSSVLRGNVIVVPIENSLLYVEPIYIISDNKDSLPEMKRVILVYNDTFIMEQTLELGLKRLFGEIDDTPTGAEAGSLEELLNDITKKFNLTKESLDELELLIKELEEKIK